DPLIQYGSYLDYALNNPYGPTTIPQAVAASNISYSLAGGCKDQIQACYDGASAEDCAIAQFYCQNGIFTPLVGSQNPYFIPHVAPDPFPPALDNYLKGIKDTIGAEEDWKQFNELVYGSFIATGDWMKNARPALEKVIDAGIKTLIYVGDADYLANYIGIERMIGVFNTSLDIASRSQSLQNWTVARQPAGLYFNAGTFSYVRVFGAGHEVPAYTHGTLEYGQAALQMFDQIMAGKGLFST
ncbi:alpha/beta-hydrolase, partial [Atractiella rhizophila]